MADEKRYIDIMIESLQKKEKVLDGLLEKCDAQAKVIAENDYGDIAWDRFNVLIVEKEALIDKLNDLDDGFQALYDRVGDELKENKESYKEEIKSMQALIKVLTDKGVSIRTKEEKNRARLERVLSSAKKEIRQSRRSMAAASNYYKSVSGGLSMDTSSKLDSKK
ncbi:MAG: flagellar protein FliT [Lachnospiraceae bacterium]|nr:flagellar protein FliT [Lachnospiraceae bacterium]